MGDPESAGSESDAENTGSGAHDSKFLEFSKELKKLEESIPILQSLNADVSGLKSITEEWKDALTSGSAQRLSEIMKNANAVLATSRGEALNNVMKKIIDYNMTAEKFSLDISPMELLLERIRASQSSGDYGDAIETAGIYRTNIEKLLTNYIVDAINDARAQTRAAETITDLSAAREQIRNAVAFAQDAQFENALAAAQDAKSAVKKSLEKEARKIFNYAMENIRSLKNSGANVSTVDTMLENANTAIIMEDWKSLMEVSDKLLEETEKLEPKIAVDLFLSSKIAVVDVKKVNMETRDLLETLRQAKAALESKDYKNAVKYSTDVRKECEKRLGTYKAATEALSAAAALISDAKRVNVNVTKTIQRLLAAKRLFESGDFKSTINTANECKKELENQIKASKLQTAEWTTRDAVTIASESIDPIPDAELSSIPAIDASATKVPESPEKLKEIIQDSQALLERLKQLGSRVDTAEDLLSKAIEYVNQGKITEANDYNDMALEFMRGEVVALYTKVAADIDGIISIVSRDEAEINDLRNSIKAVQNELDSKKPTRAMSLLNTCMENIEKLVHKQVVEKLRQLEILTRDATKVENEIIGITSQMMATSAFHKFDYRSILTFLESKRSKGGMNQETLMKLISSIRKNIEDAKKLEVDIKDFKDKLRKIIETVRRGNIEAATTSAVEIEKKLIEAIKIARSKSVASSKIV